MKRISLILALGIILVGSPVSAIDFYERDPAGSEIQSPQAISISVDLGATAEGYGSARILLRDENTYTGPAKYSSFCFSPDEPQTWILTPDPGNYTMVGGALWIAEGCPGPPPDSGFVLEDNGGATIFSILPALPLLSMPGIASIFSFVTDLMGTLWPFIAVAIAVPLTFYLIFRLKKMI